MPFALEIDTNGGLKQEYAESCPSTSNNMRSLLLHFLQPDLARW